MERVLKNPAGGATWHKWSHEHWLVAGLFGFVGTALIAIVGSTLLSCLELFVAALQAYVFTFLSAMFIGAAFHEH